MVFDNVEGIVIKYSDSSVTQNTVTTNDTGISLDNSSSSIVTLSS